MSVVSASPGLGEERAEELRKAAMDVEAVRSTPSTVYSLVEVHTYGTRTATGAITGRNPLIKT